LIYLPKKKNLSLENSKYEDEKSVEKRISLFRKKRKEKNVTSVR